MSSNISTLIYIVMIVTGLGCKPNNTELMDQAYELSSRGNHEKAIKVYTRVIAGNNRWQLAYYNRGFAYIATKQYEKALQDFDKVMSLQTVGDFIITFNEDLPFGDEEARNRVPYEDALYQRAQVLFFMDSLTRSFLDFQQLIDRNYEHKVNCLLWQGTIRIKSGLKAGGCAYFQQAKDIAILQEDKQDVQEMIQAYCP